MKPKHFAILGLYLASMILAFDVAPITIHAQSPTPNVCLNRSNGSIAKYDPNTKCPAAQFGTDNPAIVVSGQEFCVYSNSDNPYRFVIFSRITEKYCGAKTVKPTVWVVYKTLTTTPTPSLLPGSGANNQNTTPTPSPSPTPAVTTNDSIIITKPFCVTGERFVLPSDDNGCKLPPTAVVFSGQIGSSYLYDNKFYGLCFQIIPDSNGQDAITLSAPSVNTLGTAACTPPARLIPKSDFNNFLGGTQGTTGQVNTGQGNPGTGVTTGVTGGRGDCDEGFRAAGPLCLPVNPFGSNQGVAGSSSLMDIAVRVIKFLLMMSGIIAVAMMIYGGYQIMTAGGNPEQAKNGRKTLTNAVLGLIIVIFSYTVINVIVQYVITSI